MPTVRERGNTWQSMVRIKKAGIIIHQESRTFPSEKLALDWGNRLEAQIKKHGVPTRKLAAQTLGDLILQHGEVAAGIKPLRRQMEHELAQLSKEFSSLKLSSITSTAFTKFALSRRSEGAGPATIQHNLATVRSILNSAKPMFGLDLDGSAVSEALVALGRLGVSSKSNTRTRRVSDAELGQLIQLFEARTDDPRVMIPMATYVRLAVALPRRREELLTMRWVDFDPVKSTVLLRDTKNPNKARDELIPVPSAAAAIIKSLPVIGEFILPYKPESVSAAFQRAAKTLKIMDLHMHDLRHEGITRLFEAGLDIPDVALISGHMSWNMLRRYTHLKPSQVLDKLNAGIKTP